MRLRHEDRFVRYMQLVLARQEAAQELSIPRKSRRLDTVYAVRTCPPLFGPAAEFLAGRPVIFEHESRSLDPSAFRSADYGRAWLAWRWALVRGNARRRKETDVADQWLRPVPRPPIAVIIARGVSDRARALLPPQQELAAGVWATPDQHHPSLLIIDSQVTAVDDGWSFWRFLGACRDHTESAHRFAELLGDTHLPILAKAKLLESIRMNQIQLPPEEKESIFDVLRREGEERGRREGEERGRKEGEERGRRRALLDLAARLLPNDSADLAGITDVTELGLVIEQRLSGRGEG